VPGQFATIQAAVDSVSVVAGDRILVGPGDHAGAQVTKPVTIQGTGGARITSGPLHPSGRVFGFLIGATANGAGADGVTISHLTFALVDLAVFSRGANDVTVSHNVFQNPIQAVTNWGGNRWDISHNVIQDLRTSNGGGIGVLVGDYQGRHVVDNLVAHNKISGALHLAANEQGGYAGSGVVLFADFRYGFPGAASIAYNRVVKNAIALASDNSLLVDVVAFEMTDTQETTGVLHDNAVGFNDFRGTANQIALTPDALDADNAISRNLGENRGHGAHPSVFQ
jgi:hypothetical protein